MKKRIGSFLTLVAGLLVSFISASINYADASPPCTDVTTGVSAQTLDGTICNVATMENLAAINMDQTTAMFNSPAAMFNSPVKIATGAQLSLLTTDNKVSENNSILFEKSLTNMKETLAGLAYAYDGRATVNSLSLSTCDLSYNATAKTGTLAKLPDAGRATQISSISNLSFDLTAENGKMMKAAVPILR
jgi:hypothetical protein